MTKRLLAYSFILGCCDDPECRSVHIDFENQQGEVIASAVLDIDHLGQVVIELYKLEKAIRDKTGEASHASN